MQDRYENEPESGGSGFTPQDVYYAVFRQKWKILICCILGVVGAVFFYFTKPATYRSEAKLLVRYVQDTKPVDASANDSQVKSPDTRGENIINSEVEILTSLDLATQVADVVGATNILSKLGGGTNRVVAAAVVGAGLRVDVPRRSSIIRVTYDHPDPSVAQEVLRQTVSGYLRKHVEVHRAVGVFDEFLTKQTDDLRGRLAQTEEDLRKLKAQAGVIAVDETKKALTEQMSKIRQEMMEAEAELAGRQTTFQRYQELLGLVATNASTTNVSTSNPTQAVAQVTPPEKPVDPEVVRQYRLAANRVESLRKREEDLLTQFTSENSFVKAIQAQIAEAEKNRVQFEAKHPEVLTVPAQVTRSLAQPSSQGREATGPVYDVAGEATRISALQAKIRVLSDYMAKVGTEASKIDDVESRINELLRNRKLQEDSYNKFAIGLQQARVDEALGPGKPANISVVQEASPPFRDVSALYKFAGGSLGGGLAAGLLLALALEFYFDRTIRRTRDIELKLNLPLFLTVPKLRPPPKNLLADTSHQLAAPKPEGEGPAATEVGEAETAQSEGEQRLAPYSEALRDRLMMYFQLNNITHKPKLVGVTSGNRGAGVTTLAAGLAASLSETGDGNVLLVDMNLQQGPAVHPFFKGKLERGLSKLLDDGKKDDAQVSQHLYAVSAYDENAKRMGLVPKRFASLVPKLRASEYDYIIFDMPAISQTSVTAKLAGMLDMTFLVVESEKTTEETAKRASALLAESRAQVATVLNKHQTYTSGQQEQELV